MAAMMLLSRSGRSWWPATAAGDRDPAAADRGGRRGASPLAPWLARRIGRGRCWSVGWARPPSGSLLIGFAPPTSYPWLAVALALIGAGMGSLAIALGDHDGRRARGTAGSAAAIEETSYELGGALASPCWAASPPRSTAAPCTCRTSAWTRPRRPPPGSRWAAHLRSPAPAPGRCRAGPAGPGRVRRVAGDRRLRRRCRDGSRRAGRLAPHPAHHPGALTPPAPGSVRVAGYGSAVLWRWNPGATRPGAVEPTCDAGLGWWNLCATRAGGDGGGTCVRRGPVWWGARAARASGGGGTQVRRGPVWWGRSCGAGRGGGTQVRRGPVAVETRVRVGGWSWHPGNVC